MRPVFYRGKFTTRPDRFTVVRIALIVGLFTTCLFFFAGCSSDERSSALPEVEAAPVSVNIENSADEYGIENTEEIMSLVQEQIDRQSISAHNIPSAFDEACAKNSDICAWLYVPGTNVNLPIARDSVGDERYLTQEADGSSDIFGTTFVEAENDPDFSDPVTVVYGHSFSDCDVMLTQLHLFEDENFFNEHNEFFICLPDRTLTYKIVSAFTASDANILETFDFSDTDLLQAFMNFVTEPQATDEVVCESISLDAEKDRLVILSTCLLPREDGARFLVVGVQKDN